MEQQKVTMSAENLILISLDLSHAAKFEILTHSERSVRVSAKAKLTLG